MPIPVDNLPNDINELKQLVLALVQENQALLEELNIHRRKLFGRSAEPHPPQGEVFNEAEAEAEVPVGADMSCEDDACEPETVGARVQENDATDEPVPRKPRKRSPRLPSNLPREEVVVRLPPEEQVCNCCNQPMHVMGEEVREELELIPAHVRVTRYIREKYGCRWSRKSSSTSSSLRCRYIGRRRCSLASLSR